MNEYTKKLSKKLGSIADAALIFSEENRFYFTRFPSSDGWLLVTPSGALFYTDSRYTEAAARVLGEENVHNISVMFDELDSMFTEYGVETVAVENDRLTLSEFEKLSGRFPEISFNVTSALSRVIDEIRAEKDGREVGLIKQAQSIAEKAFDHVLGFIKPGVTEKEIGLELDYYMLSHGASGLSFETIAVSGVNSSMPHGVPSDKKVEKGDLITMDFGAVVNGYHSDMTRTVIVGAPTQRQKLVYDTVLEAQLACLAVLKDGVSGFDADKAARDVIAAAGFGGCFGHGTGHGVGVEIHEAPNLSPRSKHTLKTGHIVTVEPGIYLPGEFGVRIEDMALITENGCENLTKSPKELIIL